MHHDHTYGYKHSTRLKIPSEGNPWLHLINLWQSKQEKFMDRYGGTVSGSTSGYKSVESVESRNDIHNLTSEYIRFQQEIKRSIIRDLTRWIQDQSDNHYIPDGHADQWPTLDETLSQNGDDCDGLELLAYHFLRDLGFHKDEIFRAVVKILSDGQYHMVTLWYEDSEDPWVIDPTGAITSDMLRLSETPNLLVLLMVFNDTSVFTAEEK